MGHSFLLTWCLQSQFAFGVGGGSKVVALPDSVWGLRSQGLSGGVVGGDFNQNVKNGSCWEGGESE